MLAHNRRECTGANRHDRLTEDVREEGAAQGFDFGEFWHTASISHGQRSIADAISDGTVSILRRWRFALSHDPDCIFCKIVRGELGTEFIAESEHGVAFRDLQPQAPTHVLVVPRRHLAALRDIAAGDEAMIVDLLRLAVAVAEQEGIADGGYRVLTNDGAEAGQTVFHLHFHVLGGRRLHEPLG